MGKEGIHAFDIGKRVWTKTPKAIFKAMPTAKGYIISILKSLIHSQNNARLLVCSEKIQLRD